MKINTGGGGGGGAGGGGRGFRLPMRLLLAPGRGLAPGVGAVTEKVGLPLSSMAFIGWGGIRGPDLWPDEPKALAAAMRSVLAGVANTAAAPSASRVVIGCERRTRWIREKPGRWEAIDIMLTGIYWGMRMVHGARMPIGFSGAEDAVAGDFRSPMIGAKTVWDPAWNDHAVIPFIAPRYGAEPEHAAGLLARLAMGPGVREVAVWVQEYDAESQIKAIEFAAAVDAAAERM